jgi:apolipoprotein N-acyltransferase
MALAVSSGVLAYLAGPPLEWWPLIFVAFVPMVWAQHRLAPLRLAPVVPAVAISTFLITQITPGLIQGNVAWYYHSFPLFVAGFIILLSWPGRDFHARTGYRWLSVSFPLAWVAVDAVRVFSGHETLGGTWGMSIYALYGQPWLLQPLSITGIFGLQLLVLMQNFGLAHLLIAWTDRGRQGTFEYAPAAWSGAVVSVAVIGALSVLWVGTSLLQYQHAPSSTGNLRVATVQANSTANAGVELQRLIEGTREAGARGAQITVWREGALDFDPQRERADEFRALAAETGSYIAIGYSFTEQDGLRRNEAVVVAPDGNFFGPYGKDHPGRFAGDHSDTGGDYKVYSTTLGRIATIICYDLDFTDTAREMVRRGAEFIAVPSHDPPALARTHYTHLVFRAIENRVPMAKADAMADSAIIDAYGHIVDLIVHPFSARQAREVSEAMSLPIEVLVANVDRRDQMTLYTRIGDWAGWLAILGALAIFCTHVTRVFRGRSQQ